MFKKGKPKTGGRKKGVGNRISGKLREAITSFLENNFEAVQSDFELLEPAQRVKFYVDLLPFSLPKLQSVTNSFEQLTDQQLDEIINKLKKLADENI